MKGAKVVATCFCLMRWAAAAPANLTISQALRGSASGTTACGTRPQAKRFEFENNCNDDIVLIDWGQSNPPPEPFKNGCLVPAGATCFIGEPGSCTKQAAANPANSEYPLCDAVNKRRARTPSGGKVLEWCLVSADHYPMYPNGRQESYCAQIESSPDTFMGPGQGGESCIGNLNGNMHSGMTMSYRAQVLDDESNQACRDGGMEISIPDYHGSDDQYSCDPSLYSVNDTVPKEHGCNTYMCFCKDAYIGGCQTATPCNTVFDNTWTILQDEGREYRCRGFCQSARAGAPTCSGNKPGPPPNAANEWVTDKGFSWVLGINFDKTCKSLTQEVTFKVTSCGIGQKGKKPTPDAACSCGAEDTPNIGCPSTFSPR